MDVPPPGLTYTKSPLGGGSSDKGSRAWQLFVGGTSGLAAGIYTPSNTLREVVLLAVMQFTAPSVRLVELIS